MRATPRGQRPSPGRRFWYPSPPVTWRRRSYYQGRHSLAHLIDHSPCFVISRGEKKELQTNFTNSYQLSPTKESLNIKPTINKLDCSGLYHSFVIKVEFLSVLDPMLSLILDQLTSK